MKIQPPSPEFIPARFHGGAQKPRCIVIHGTVSHDDPGTARHIAEWWHGPTSPTTSAHYVVDPAEVIQCVGDHTVAYHCGHNQDSIGIELCDEQTGPASRWDDKDSQAILDRAADLAARLCVVYGIDPHRPTIAELKAHGVHGIYGHNDSRLAFGQTTHSDPGTGFPWKSFLASVQRKATQLTQSTSRQTEVVVTANLPTKSTPNIKTGVDRAKAGLLTLIQKQQPDIVCLQEFGAHPEVEGWAFTKSHPVVGWRTSRYSKVAETSVLLAKGRDVEAEKGRRSHLPDERATIVELVEPGTGDRVQASSGHLPAHVEVKGLYRKVKDQLTGRAAMHRQARRKWRAELEKRAKHADRTYLAGDTNYQLMRLRGFWSCWNGHAPLGTFGSRTIDTVYAKRRAHEVTTITIPSDHRAVRATYLI